MPRFLAIDGDQSQIHVAAASVTRGAVRVERALTWAAGQPVTAASAADLGRALREQMKAAGIAPAPLLVCLGRDRVVVKEVKFPPVAEAEEAALVRFQAAKEFTESADELVIDYFPLPVADPVGERRAATVAVRREILRAWQAFASAAGLKLVAVTPRPLAAVGALQRAIASGAVTPVESLAASVALMARSARWGELTIARGGDVVFTRTLSGPALASETALLGELRRNLTVYNSQNPQASVQAVYVAEADSPVGWGGRVRAGLTVPVYSFDPLAGIPGDTALEDRGAFAGLVGLFALMARADALPVNFAAPREPKPVVDPAKRLVALVAPVLALVLLGGIGLGVMAKMERERTINLLLAEKAELEQEMAKYEEDAKRVKALDDWTGRGVVWLDELYDLTSRFPDPAGTRIQSLTVTARDPEKNAKTRYVAHVEMKIETEDGKAIDRLVSEMVRDGHYRVGPKEPKGAAGFGLNRFNQAFVVRADVEPRKPGQYTRRLPPTPPVQQRGPDDGDRSSLGLGEVVR